jgi:hypothetical protein
MYVGNKVKQTAHTIMMRIYWGGNLESDADRPLSINVCRQYNQEDRHTIMMRIYWGGYLESDADRQLSMNVCRQ